MVIPPANQTQQTKAPNNHCYSKLLHVSQLYSISSLIVSPSFHMCNSNISANISPKSHRFHCLLQTYKDPGFTTDASSFAYIKLNFYLLEQLSN